MFVALAFIVLLVGLLMYAFAVNPKVAEIGRIMFAFGLLVFLFTVSSVNITWLAIHR